jgi:hypothetical protein
LNLRPRKSGKHEEHPKPGFDRGLGLRLGEINNAPKPGDAPDSRMLADIRQQLGDGYEPGMKEQVRGDDSLGQRS